MKKLTFYIISLFIFISCSDRNEGNMEGSVADEVEQIAASFEPVKAAPGISLYDDNDVESSDPDATDEFIFIKDIQPDGVLYISQLGPSSNPNFNYNPNEQDDSNSSAPYCYAYQYYENPEADWNKEYNFKNIQNPVRTPILWSKIRKVGSVGNAFSFFAFYYPVDNTIKWEVQADQTGGETDPYDKTNFMKSDIMGAYHATSSLYSRLRFRLFHLMVYLKVTLYVPVYESYTSPVDEITYSGYEENALLGGFVMNANRSFSIEWRANRSSDTEAPLVQSNSNDKDKDNIQMYLHRIPADNSMTLTDVTDFYPAYKGENNEDKVRVYNFSVIFPSQTFGDRFLCFVLKDHEGHNRYYYFSASNQLMGVSGNYSLTQGTLQQLYLYLPRTSNETILVGAKILPWLNSETNMTVNKEPKNGSVEDQNDDDIP